MNHPEMLEYLQNQVNEILLDVTCGFVINDKDYSKRKALEIFSALKPKPLPPIMTPEERQAIKDSFK